MNNNSCYIISLDSSEIYEQIKENGVDKGYILPDNSDDFFALFNNTLDYSLDSIELEKCFKKIIRRKFFKEFPNKKNKYTTAVININFKHTYKGSDENRNLYELRNYFYENGFNLAGEHYVRYKRSSGSSRQGKCLFIIDKLLKHMEKWSEFTLEKEKGDLASWESYKSLSLSSLYDTIDIPLDGILIIDDYKSEFEDDVVCVKTTQENELNASYDKIKIKNDIWDGESLLDESLFINNNKYSDKHMLLLRNKFFKSCGFRTKLQKWFKDKKITIDELKSKGFYTNAKSIDQIVMVTTPNSLKFLKFMQGGFNSKNINIWLKNIDKTFGVVKFDKRTRFLNGELVQSSYQFINTLGLDENQVEKVLKPSKDYLDLIRNDYDFLNYHFNKFSKKEKSAYDNETNIFDGELDTNESEADIDDDKFNISEYETDIDADEIGSYDDDDIIENTYYGDLMLKLMSTNYEFKDTKLFYKLKNFVVRNQKDKMKEGHILLPGTNATIFGNGPEMLLALSGEFGLKNEQLKSLFLDKEEIACFRFKNKEKLVCARSPHITMGNLYCVVNNIDNPIWDYFDLGENIVCVNAIKENIQQRLNGCDYDSDTMLITNESTIVSTAFNQKDRFKVPVCDIEPGINSNISLVQLDYKTSKNKIGEIVNLSQKLNSYLWDKINHNKDFEDIYLDICKLAILSNIEIDKAKRSYDMVDVNTEIEKIREKYKDFKLPNFFKPINNKKDKDKYGFYKTAMEYVYKSVNEINYRKGKSNKVEYKPISMLLKNIDYTEKSTSTDYEHRDKIIKIIEDYVSSIKSLCKKIRKADKDEKDCLFSKIDEEKERVKKEVREKLNNNEHVLFLILKQYEKEEKEKSKEKGKSIVKNWNYYTPLLETTLFENMLTKSKEKLKEVIQQPNGEGEYDIFGLKFTKK